MKTSLIVGVIVVILIVVIGGYFLMNPYGGTNKKTDTKNVGNEDTGVINGDTETGNNNQASQPRTYDIEIKNFDYSQKELRIKAGDIVIWTNKDSTRHTITSDSGDELDSELLAVGETYSQTFNQPGTFSYHCTPHPYMKGKIIVE